MPARNESAAAANCLSPYRRHVRFLLWGSALGAGLLSGGCAGLPLPGDVAVTGSIAPRAVSAQVGEPAPGGVASEDWAFARLALNEALSQKSAAPSVPWENPVSATRGTATPVGEPAPREGASCREFLVSFVRPSGEQWLQGEACRTSTTAAWKVDQARLLQRT